MSRVVCAVSDAVDLPQSRIARKTRAGLAPSAGIYVMRPGVGLGMGFPESSTAVPRKGRLVVKDRLGNPLTVRVCK